MPHNNHRSVQAHRTAIFLGVLLVLIFAHIALLLAQSESPSRQARLRAEGQWAAVRHSLGLPPLPAHAKPAPKLPPLPLRVSSRFDLKHKRALEESAAPPQLYFAADALVDEISANEPPGVVADPGLVELKGTKRRGRNERGVRTRID
ncbi:hypothetical protein B0H17DRAFT_1194749 [Mycena rosella]|uniref:Uncharacterized protein n=1 Tax=Mycena rosella TaxID=1033263 RepID=A0AAD7DXP8_MYCRO|nr:hypothetical protein B0H17DRAFT_1194749 [Mycena rosella]